MTEERLLRTIRRQAVQIDRLKEQLQAERAARFEAERKNRRDENTGLFNVIALQEELASALSTDSALVSEGVALLILDGRGFRVINRRGHTVGDQFLRDVANRLVKVKPPSAHVFRLYRGDEFAAIFYHVPTFEIARREAELFMTQLAGPYPLEAERFEVSFRGGLTWVNHPVDSLEFLIQADKNHALKEDLTASPFLQPGGLAWLKQRRRSLVRQVMADKFGVAFFPKVDLEGYMVGVEALMEPAKRWSVSNEEAATLIEADLRASRHLSLRVMNLACERISQWPAASNLIVSVNFAASVLEPSLYDVVMAALERWSFDPARFRIEITERGEVAPSNRQARITIKRLCEQGVTFALDDIGRRGIPHRQVLLLQDALAELKADSHVWKNGKLEDVMGLAQGFGWTVTVEGVETRRQHRRVATLAKRLEISDQTHIQGGLVGLPTDAAEFEEKFLRAQPVLT